MEATESESMTESSSSQRSSAFILNDELCLDDELGKDEVDDRKDEVALAVVIGDVLCRPSFSKLSLTRLQHDENNPGAGLLPFKSHIFTKQNNFNKNKQKTKDNKKIQTKSDANFVLATICIPMTITFAWMFRFKKNVFLSTCLSLRPQFY